MSRLFKIIFPENVKEVSLHDYTHAGSYGQPCRKVPLSSLNGKQISEIWFDDDRIVIEIEES